MNSLDLIAALDSRHPGLQRLVNAIAGYFQYPEDRLCQQMNRELQSFTEEQLQQACSEFTELGIFPDIQVDADAQVAAMWQSPIFQSLMAALAFYPPADLDLLAIQPPAITCDADIPSRFLSLYEEPYWKVAMYRTFPELYLEPYLATMTKPITGCDLACGWGRASLALHDYQGIEIYCCDLSHRNLDLVTTLAASAGRAAALHPVRCDLTNLPFPDSHFDFFMALDIFEHLTDPCLDRVLTELLRSAKVGAALFAEIPVYSYCPAITHVQNFHPMTVIARFQNFQAHGKSFRMRRFDPRLPDQFSFKIVRATQRVGDILSKS